MQLIDFLKTADKGEYIYLGAAYCFLWIAKPDQMIAKLPELDDRFIDGIQAKIQKYSSVAKACAADSMMKKWAQKKIAALSKQIKSYIPLANREIKDAYKRKAVEPLGTIVIIDGEEKGRYWSLDEMEKDDGKETKEAD